MPFQTLRWVEHGQLHLRKLFFRHPGAKCRVVYDIAIPVTQSGRRNTSISNNSCALAGSNHHTTKHSNRYFFRPRN